jgi:hypothetical protein
MSIEMSRDEIAAKLRKSRGTVIFVKADGTDRVMYCTLQKEFLPETIDVEEYISDRNPVSDEVLAVWDLDKKDWRSFRIDRVQSIVFSEV